MPAPSSVAIRVAGIDVTNKVLYSTARFEGQLSAVPGTAEMTVRDPDQTLSFVTGDEWTLDIDGQRRWGGFVLTANKTFAFPAVDTTTPANVKVRQWKLTGLDYNVLFDKRVIRDASSPPASYLSMDGLTFTLDRTMGDLLRNELLDHLLDIAGDGLDTTTFVDSTYVPRFDASGNPAPDATKHGTWPQQGSYWRAAMDGFSQFGTIYYIDGAKNVHFHEVESTAAAWGFSDQPNKLALPAAGATYGMREFEEIETAEAMGNDAFVWGGSEFSGASGGTVFARATNAGSISTHKRWQYAETRFGDLRSQGEVKARANVIVSGNTTGAVGGDTSRGISVNQKQVRLAWFGHDVPMLSGQRVHLKPSDVVTMTMHVLTEDGINPLVIVLPLRTLRISFPTLPASGSSHAAPKTYVRFDGFFGVQLSDPYWLWKFLRDLKASPAPTPLAIATADGSTTTAVYGAYGSFAPAPVPDGSTTVFTVPFAYIPGTVNLYQDGRLLAPGLDYTESDPTIGEITFTGPPSGAVSLWVNCRISGGI